MSNWKEVSPLQYPILVLHGLSKGIKEYHGGIANHASVYEHVYAGLIYTAISAKLDCWWLYSLAFFGHVILKELILDWKKNAAKSADFFWRDLLSQLMERSYGFILGLPFFI